MTRILIVGATSAIAEAAARQWLARDPAAQFVLAARNSTRLEAIAADLRLRGATVATHPFDALDFDAHATLLDAAWTALGAVDAMLVAHGSLPDQRACEQSASLTLREFSINALSVIALCTAAAERFQAQRRGTLAVIGSVAGDRGRQSNYVYGAAKGAVDVFLQGLRNRLWPQGVAVVTIKPGFVDTPMTAAFAKTPLWATPAAIAPALVDAVARGADVVYLPGRWRLIMAIIRAIPEALFKRLKL
jgi:decaprenylphospho-beta-D-erythro-pentofuranosid-2-ulose 2-reductase